jgi:peptidylprolyl isomerase
MFKAYIFGLALAITAMPSPAQTPPLDAKTLAARLQAPDNLRLPPANAVRTASGLRYIILKRGSSNAHPLPSSTVVIDYTGWDFQGRVFDSSLPDGKPARFPLSGLIQGWQEGVPLMSPGDTFRFWIPGKLAYDSAPEGSDSPRGKLVFDITLHAIDDSP